jgi:hypothetical protein
MTAYSDLHCPYCGILVSEEYDAEEDSDGEVRTEKLGDHFAFSPSCYAKDKERRRQRYGY